MGAQPPDGDPAPTDGRLPASALAVREFGVYVHVPFCASRCGYCDFNTYTAAELGDAGSVPGYLEAAAAEIGLAAEVLGPADRPVSTVFFGGGTPTLLEPRQIGELLAAIRDRFGLLADTEVTCEANPDSVTAADLVELRAAGITRMSFGMQSTSTRALAVLDRTHTPGRAIAAIAEARAAGFEHVNVDLIYATPGESATELIETVQAAAESGVDHVSAYALIVEAGTRLAAQVAHGEVVATQDDHVAEHYVIVDDLLSAAGFDWYEVSNWAKSGAECRHNLGYWRGIDWWGIGPGAHSHVGGVRWWNVRHPAAYAERLAVGVSPAQSREVLSGEDRRIEDVLLRLRLRAGLPLDVLNPLGRSAAAAAAERGLLEPTALVDGLAVLTQNGRLLADAVVRDLVD
jgi:putative oxygen-independent coproporphyrinogen III oxidase